MGVLVCGLGGQLRDKMVESDNFLNKLHPPLLTFLKMDNKLVSSTEVFAIFFLLVYFLEQ